MDQLTKTAASPSPDLAVLFAAHVQEKMRRFKSLLKENQLQEVIIASGNTQLQFQDDMAYPFKANPYFREWLPLNKRAGCYLKISVQASKPLLLLDCAEDIWHTAPQSLPAGFEACFDIVEYETQDQLNAALRPAAEHSSYIAQDNPLKFSEKQWNPLSLLVAIDFQRAAKTPYEQESVREANRLAAPAHRAAYHAFMAGESELEICAAYLRACACSENEMPYSVIAGVNEHAAVLHHFRLDRVRPRKPRSFLLDAGVDVRGYASDITRTYAFDESSEFAAMIHLMDQQQQSLVAAASLGKHPADLHELALRKVAEVLKHFEVILTTVDEALETGLVNTFCPHGLGHPLGCNVHDKGGHLANSKGDVIPPPERYPKLRHTAPIVANQIHTIEPGLYFIPALLAKLHDSKMSRHVNWSRVESFLPYGGIRIEDNIIVHKEGSLENLTRQAFADLQD